MSVSYFTSRAFPFSLCAGVLLLAGCDTGDPVGPPASGAIAPPDQFNASMARVDICHRNSSGEFVRITIADAAYETHLEHGDAGVGEPVPGMGGFEFDEACQPVEAIGLEIVPATISVGENHICGLDVAGSAYCWGSNWEGELGDGTTTESSWPVAVVMPAGESFAAIGAGRGYTVALSTTGIAFAWGGNWEGVLGDGTTTNSSTPVAVSMPTGEHFTAISAGDAHVVALTAAGIAYAWGGNWAGQLGDGTTTSSNTPTAVMMPPGESFMAISAGGGHSIAVTVAGAAYAWGSNWAGQLGDGTTASSSTPKAVMMPSGESLMAISAGGTLSVGLTATGAAYAWGLIDFEGNEFNPSTSPEPVVMPPGENFASVSAGGEHFAALTPEGVAYGWGINWDGQLGTGTTTASNTPVAVDTDDKFVAISAGAGPRFSGAMTAAISTAGAAYAWGRNDYGLGDGATTSSTTPVVVAEDITFAH